MWRSKHLFIMADSNQDIYKDRIITTLYSDGALIIGGYKKVAVGTLFCNDLGDT